MTHLSLLVRWRGGIVASTTLALRDGVCIGDDPASDVYFPGSTLEVRRDRFGWTLAGHRLLQGRRLVFGLGAVEVTAEPHIESRSDRTISRSVDVMLFVATAASMLLASSWLAAERVMAHNPHVVTALQARWLGEGIVEAGEPDSATPASGGLEISPPVTFDPHAR